MAATYKQFLAAPNSSLLADKASLHYVTTTTSFAGATDIIKHLNSLQKQVKKKKEEIINLIDGQSVIAVEVDTGLEFQTSGGVYLPGLDDNFLSDRVAYLPILHIVTFDDNGKIAQIRLQWDQGSLLKQLEIIGKSGRNWPIRDSREQLTLIQSCLKSSGHVPVRAPSHNEAILHTRGKSTHASRDPHASLHLFGSREDRESLEPAPVISPYAGQKPQQRSFADILGDEPTHGGDYDYQRSMSPSKVGQGKNHQPSRIFNGQQDVDEVDSPTEKSNTYIRADPSKFKHFDFVDGSDPNHAPEPGVPFDQKPKSKHDSQWSFEDFVTPAKSKPSRGMRPSEPTHWSMESSTAETKDLPLGKSRRDAEKHFELQDDGELPPSQQRIATRQKGVGHNQGHALYQDNIFGRDETAAAPDRALGNITNIKSRGKEFDPHFTMSDDSPAPVQRTQHVPENRRKAVKMMDVNWSLADESPTSQKENTLRSSRPQNDSHIHIAGDGMGGKKGTGRHWLYGGDDVAEPHKPIISRKPNQNSSQKSFNWDF